MDSPCSIFTEINTCKVLIRQPKDTTMIERIRHTWKVMLKWILKKWDARCGLQPAYERIMWHVLMDISLKNDGGGERISSVDEQLSGSYQHRGISWRGENYDTLLCICRILHTLPVRQVPVSPIQLSSSSSSSCIICFRGITMCCNSFSSKLLVSFFITWLSIFQSHPFNHPAVLLPTQCNYITFRVTHFS